MKRLLAALVLVVAGLAALGCEARVSLGASCIYSSECGALRCLYGRCRAECLTNVDCSAGLVCNAGVCAEPSESCSADDPCLAPERACAGSICAERCSASGTCALGARCETRVGGLVCVPVESTPVDAGLDARATDDVGGLDAASDDAATPSDAAVSLDAASGTGAIRDLCVSRYHVCVARGDGTVVCWGTGPAGELGGGAPLVAGVGGARACMPFGVPVPCTTELVTVVQQDDSPLDDIVALSCGERATLARTSSGQLYSWGWGSSGELGRDYDGAIGSWDARADLVTDRSDVPLSDIQSAAIGLRHACARRGDGTVYCWGGRYDPVEYGKLGTGAADPAFAPGALEATAFAGAASIAMADQSTCAGRADGVSCVGQNASGAVGDTSALDTLHTSPLRVMGVTSTPSAIVAGPSFYCALVGEAAHCWGHGGEGSLGRGPIDALTATCPGGVQQCDPRASPVTSPAFRSIASGAQSSTVCGLTTTGQVHCWGNSEDGVAGSTSRVERPEPIEVSPGNPLEGVRLVRVGGATACAVTIDDRLHCWGNNESGQLRVDPDAEPHTRAVLVPLD
jgi:alpha-tubulin suppressor-like RCC1 family protein